MNNQRLRNLTTDILHTRMQDIYEDIAYITGIPGIMTHQIPNALRAILPYLKEHIKDERFWDGKFDQTHTGEFDIAPMSPADREAMLERFS